MQTTIETVTVITMRLTNEEAIWLKGVMQNPIHVDMPEDEDSHDRIMRMRYWEALNKETNPL